MSDFTTSAGEMKAIPRGRNRSVLSAPGARLTTWIPTTTYDQINALANRRGESVASVVRQMLVLRFKP